MAEAPKSTNRDGAAATKGKTSDATAKALTDSKGKIEDAVVTGETAPRAATSAAKPKPTPKSETGAEAFGKPKSTAKVVPPPKADETVTNPGQTKPEASKTDAAQTRRGGFGSFLGLLLGGVAAAVIGFVAARTVVPEGWPFPGVAPAEDPLVATIEAQGAQIAAFEDRMGEFDATLAEVKSDTSAIDALRESLAERLDGLQTGAQDIADQLETMDTRLGAVEKLAPEGSAAAEAAAQAYARELEGLREMFAGELAEIDAAQAEATALKTQLVETAEAAAGRAALAQVLSAIDTGEPFVEALGEVAEITGTEAPSALAEIAVTGAPALADLQRAFPAAARSAIEAATRAGVEDGSLNRMQAFLRTQLGTRSIEPKEGDDADAVLSRAEAALTSGDLDAALVEIDALPESAKPAFADWQALADTRAAALAAGKLLTDAFNPK